MERLSDGCRCENVSTGSAVAETSTKTTKHRLDFDEFLRTTCSVECVYLDEEAKSELRQLIRQHLSEELKKLRVSVDEQIKASEDAISKRLQAAGEKEGAPASAKGKKK